VHGEQETSGDRPLPLEVLSNIVQLFFTMLDLRRLRLLRELNARGTIGAVAEALSYSPSAVSQQLALLEREAGVPLLERAGRNVRLTAAAQRLVVHTDALLARLEEAEADLEATAEQITGTVRVAAIQSAGLYLLAPALRLLAAEHPALRVEVTDAEPETTMPALALGTLDLVLGDEYPFFPRAPDPRVDIEPLLEERFRVMLPAEHPLARGGGPVALADLRHEAWAVGKDGSHYGELAIRACRALVGFEPDIRHRSNDLLMLLALVAAGQAVTLLPDLVRPDREPNAVARDVAEAPLTRTVYGAIRHGSARRPALNALRAALRETAAGLRSAATPAP
jgi:DNA-binding transcriptional LysR family regulator